jgi:hypothetical protein
MPIDQVANISISAEANTPTQENFGVPMLVGFHNLWTERSRTYSRLEAFAADGASTRDALYQAMKTAFAQRPRPPAVKVGRRASAFAQVVDLTPASPSNGKRYAATVDGTEYAYVATGSDNLAAVCTALAAALNTALDADADAIIATGVTTTGTQTLTTTSLDGAVGTGVMSPARALAFVFSSHANWDATVAVVTGTDAAGNTITENFGIPDGGNSTTTGVRLFRTVTQVVIPAQSGTNGTYTLGTVARTSQADLAAIISGGESSGSLQTLDEGDFDGRTGGDVMDPPRTLAFAFGVHANWDASNITVTGLDQAGNTITETFAIPNNGGATVAGTKRFAQVTGVSIPAQSGTGGSFVLGTTAPFTAAGGSGTKVVVTTTDAGHVTTFKGITKETITGVKNQTPDPGLEADLNAIKAVDNDWYGLALDSNSEAETAVAASWAEAQGKLFAAQSADTACKSADSTTDVAADLVTAGYARTSFCWHSGIGAQGTWLSLGLMAKQFTAPPGSDDWDFKKLAGVDVDTLTDTEFDALRVKNATVYVRTRGINVTRGGDTPDGEHVDVVRFVDWLNARMNERYVFLRANNPKIAYTDAGIAKIVSEFEAQLADGVTAGGLDPGNEDEGIDPPTVTAPRVADISPTDRANRHLPNVTFSARLAGSVRTIDVTGTLVP